MIPGMYVFRPPLCLPRSETYLVCIYFICGRVCVCQAPTFYTFFLGSPTTNDGRQLLIADFVGCWVGSGGRLHGLNWVGLWAQYLLENTVCFFRNKAGDNILFDFVSGALDVCMQHAASRTQKGHRSGTYTGIEGGRYIRSFGRLSEDERR